MKKSNFLLLLAIILGIFFTSCTKDVSGPVDLNYIEGKWSFNKSTISYSGFTLPFSNEYLKNEDGCTKDYLQILAGGTAKVGNYAADCAFDEKVGSCSLSGTTLRLSIAESSLNETFKVAKLSSNELILQIDGTYDGKSGTLNLYLTK